MSRVFLLFAVVLGGDPVMARINFVPRDPFPIPKRPDFFTVGEFNRDGIADLVSASKGSDEVAVLLGSETGRFRLGVTQLFLRRTLNDVAVADFNQDSLQDIAVADQSTLRGGRVWFMLGKGDGTFIEPYAIEVGRNPVYIAAEDFDLDGDFDVAVTDPTGATGQVEILVNVGGQPPIFQTAGVYEIGKKPLNLVTGLFNRGDLPDMAALNTGGLAVKDISILLNAGVSPGAEIPTFEERARLIVGKNPFALITAELNADGQADLALVNNPPGRTVYTGTIEILYGRADGLFDGPRVVEIPCPLGNFQDTCRPRQGKRQLGGGDFDGDGTDDLGVTIVDARPQIEKANDWVTFFRVRPNGAVVPKQTLETQLQPNVVAVADFTGDGRPDFAVGAASRFNVTIYENASTTPEGNGTPCGVDDDCSSEVCLDGLCCERRCSPDETCDVPGREGECVPVKELGEECEFGQECRSDNCVDGVCCSTPDCAFGERCDIYQFEGMCHELLDPGETCLDDMDCRAVDTGEEFGYCVDGVCCLVQACADGDACVAPDGECATRPTPTPTPLRLGPGERCDDDNQCELGLFCTDNVCCVTSQCPAGQFCAPLGLAASEAGTCVRGTPPPSRTATATFTPRPTRIPSVPPTPPTPTCPPGFDNTGGVCTSVSRGGGCSAGSDGGHAAASWLLLLPVAAWVTRRSRFQRN